jgi:2'-5' RNA ligase
MRLFVSIPLPQLCIDELIKIQTELRTAALFEGTFVAPENMHITLAFFGSVSEDEYKTIDSALAEISYPSFTIQLKALELNSRSHPHVIWASIDAPALTPFVMLITEKLPQHKQDRAFNGHITIARIKNIHNKERFLNALNCMLLTPIIWSAREFKLVSSTTLPEGPVYKTVSNYSFY